MKSTIQQDEIHEPHALLITEDVGYIEPIREYLASQGCTVIVNKETPVLADYSIVCGTPLFVKGIFSSGFNLGYKLLAVIWSRPSLQSKTIQEEFPNCKIVYSDIHPLAPAKVKRLFAYFFTGTEPYVTLGEFAENRNEINTTHSTSDKPKIENECERQSTSESNLPKYQPKTHTSWLETHVSFAQVTRKETEEGLGGTRVIREEDEGKEREEKQEGLHTTVQSEMFNKEPKRYDMDSSRVGKLIKDVYDNNASVAIPEKRFNLPSIRFHFLKRPIVVFVALILTIVLPFFLYAFDVTIAAVLLYGSARTFSQKQLVTQPASTQATAWWIGQSRSVFGVVAAELTLVGNVGEIRSQEQVLGILEDGEAILRTAYDMRKDASLLATAMFAPQVPSDESSIVTVHTTRISLQDLHDKIGLLIADIKSIQDSEGFTHTVLLWVKDTLFRKLGEALDVTQIAHDSLGLWEKIGGYDKEKRYLVLFQNSMELRPTGGFIGSLALVTVSDGKIREMTIQDVYDVDGQLKGHVDPPRPIRELLGQEHWYLRDSNWDPDFSLSGNRALWFYEKETGEKLDGTIAISSSLLSDLLALTGPIDLPDYNDRITADNFFAKSLYYTQVDFFPGSKQKKNFLGALANAILVKLTTDKSVDNSSLFSLLYHAYKRHDILVSFPTEENELLAKEAGWGGGVPILGTCQASDTSNASCFEDWMYQAEANMSMNKVNYFIHRSQNREETITETGEVSGTVSYVYRNESTGDTQMGGGDYRPYVQYYFPQDVEITRISIDGNQVEKRDDTAKKLLTVPYYEKIATTSASAAYGLVFDVPKQSSRVVTISYKHTKRVAFSDAGSLVHIVSQKQPGMSDDSYRLVIHYPTSWIPVDQIAGQEEMSVANTGQLEYNTQMSEDHDIQVRFIR